MAHSFLLISYIKKILKKIFLAKYAFQLLLVYTKSRTGASMECEEGWRASPATPSPPSDGGNSVEEQVMSDVHLGCPPNHSGPHISYFTILLPPRESFTFVNHYSTLIVMFLLNANFNQKKEFVRIFVWG